MKCEFTDAEITALAKELAAANNTRDELEQQKKQVDSQLKADIEVQNSTIGRLSRLIGSGWEMRNVEVRIELDTPEPGKKRVVRIDTGEEVAVKAMTDRDRQMVLDLQSAAEVDVDLTKTRVVNEALHAVVDLHAGLASAVAMGGTHQAKGKRKRDREAEAVADGSAE